MKRLQDYLSASAEAWPGRLAIAGEDEQATFAELESRTNQLAHLLIERGIRHGDRVGVMAPKSIAAIAAFVAVLKAGGIYVPLDPAGPATRVGRMIEVSGCRAILNARDALPVLDQCSEAVANTADIGALDLQVAETAARSWPSTTPNSVSRPEDPAHILFTSGSTGLPKGVVVTHRNVIAFVTWANAYFARDHGDRVSGHSPLQFDLSTYDIFGAIAAGAELHLVPARLNLFPKDLPDFIRERRLTQWFSAPSVLAYLCRFDALHPGDFPEMRELLWCGEVFAIPALRYWMERLPHVRFTNLYGPTEATIASTYFTMTSAPKDDRATTPIGKACEDEEVAVVGDHGRVLPQGETGEICIAGGGVTNGYWRDEAKTNQAFPPVAEGMRSRGRMYRTGDLGLVDQNGDFRFVGRLDTQIKSRGHRIELGEIEVAVNSLPQIAEAAVLALAVDDFSGTEIACVYSLLDHVSYPATALRRDLAKLVPRYMLPARYESRDKLPLNSNGKIDRVKLRAELQDAGAETS